MKKRNCFLEAELISKTSAKHSLISPIKYNDWVMKQSVNSIKNFWWIPLGVLLIAFLVLGTYVDRDFSCFIHSNNFLAPVIAYIGSAPGYALVGFVGPLLFLGLRNSKKEWVKSLGFAALFTIPLVSGFVYGYDVFFDSIKVIGVIVGAVIIIALDGLLLIPFWKSEGKDAIKDAFVIAIAFAFTFITVFVLKNIIERPRPLYVFNHIDDFKPFLDFSSNIEGADKDLLDSFPSGHSAIAATFLLCPILCKHNEKTKNLGLLFFIFAALWLALTMLGRMIGGYHYLSDVSMGAIIGTFFSFLTNFLSQFIKIEKKDEAENG